jgi:transposase-like protein
MSRCFRYSASRKIEAVRRVVEDGRRVCDVATELGVSEGSLFFWVRRYREFALRACRRSAGLLPAPPHAQVEPVREAGSLVAWLRRANAAQDVRTHRCTQAAKSGKADPHRPHLASNR